MAIPARADSTLTFRVEDGGIVLEIEARSREPGSLAGLGQVYALQLRYMADGLRLTANSDAGAADLERFAVDLQRFGAPGTAECELRCVHGRMRLHRTAASAGAVLDMECSVRSQPTRVQVLGMAVRPDDILRLQAWCGDLTRRR